MFRAVLIVASVLGAVSFAGAAPPAAGRPAAVESPAMPHGPACGPAVLHVSLLAEAQMCPRPLAMTVITPPHRRSLHT